MIEQNVVQALEILERQRSVQKDAESFVGKIDAPIKIGCYSAVSRIEEWLKSIALDRLISGKK